MLRLAPNRISAFDHPVIDASVGAPLGDIGSEPQSVELRIDESPHRVGGRADDGLPAHVETRVDQDGAARQLVEGA